MAYRMHLGISDMNYGLLNGLPEHLHADCLPPSLKLNHAEGEFFLEPPLLIRGDAIYSSPKLVSNTLRISQAPGRGVCLSIRYGVLKLQSLVGGYVCCPISHIFGGSFPLGMFFCQYASGTVPLVSTSCTSCRS